MIKIARVKQGKRVSNNTVRTIVIFGIIALVLGGATVGAVRLLKARNSSYASQQNQPTATNNQPQEQQNPQGDQKKDEPKKDESQPQSQPNQSNTQSNPAPQTPAPTPTNQSQPQNNSPSSVAATGATPQNGMPATGPTDFFATVGLMMLAIFFGAKLIRVRADFRRYIGS